MQEQTGPRAVALDRAKARADTAERAKQDERMGSRHSRRTQDFATKKDTAEFERERMSLFQATTLQDGEVQQALEAMERDRREAEEESRQEKQEQARREAEEKAAAERQLAEQAAAAKAQAEAEEEAEEERKQQEAAAAACRKEQARSPHE